jgi:FADH2 O2-dependent halogenase
MTRIDADVGILGAGFGGSLMAILLRRIGLRPVLIDRGSHPRFAIGESSTPIADLVLGELSARYDLPRIAPLGKYGTWRRAYPRLTCGLKRGFSYFCHRPGEPFTPNATHDNELLVAASSSDDASDTHWYRPEFDQLLADEAVREGVEYFDRARITAIGHDPHGWRIEAQRHPTGDQPLAAESTGNSLLEIHARFLIDASGDGCVLARHLDIATDPAPLRTRSRAIFAHFEGVRPWHDLLVERGARVTDHPFRCDAAALHHILDRGWMWVLGFGDGDRAGVTSAGFVLDCDAWPLDPDKPIQREWDEIMARFPTLAEQFAQATVVAPEGGLRRSGRLQRIARRAAGSDWAMLPTTAGIIDALHSTGNAHNLTGIQRLVHLLEEHWGRPGLPAALAEYDRAVRLEIAQIDQLVHGCFVAFRRFELLTAFATWYFVAATTSEERRRAGVAAGDLFLQSQDPAFRLAMQQSYDALLAVCARPTLTDDDVARFQSSIAAAVAPYNHCGFCDPARHNMYPHLPADASR